MVLSLAPASVRTVWRPLGSIEQLIDSWYEDERRAVAILLAGFVVCWTIFHVVANASIGLHADNLEAFAWGRHLQAGYQPHPPLSALLTAAWFTIFPATDWAFDLLTMANAAVALYAIDLISRRFLRGDKRLLVLLLLLLTPFYVFRAQRFSVNALLLSGWPIATYCFLRAFETRRLGWSSAAGATAALAMLAKYYSIYLIAAFIIAALTHRDRWHYLRSPAPWFSILVGLLVLAPHVYWLATTGFQPFHYALSEHAGATLGHALWKAAIYAGGGSAYVVLLLGAFWLATRPRFRTLGQALWPPDPDLRMLAVVLWSALVLPILTAPLFGAVLTPVWTAQSWFLLPILLLAPPQLLLPRLNAIRVAAVVLCTTVMLLLASPVLALARFGPAGKPLVPTEDYRITERAVAQRVTALWHQITGRPLTIVAGRSSIPAYAITFYSADHPDSVFVYDLSRPGYDLTASPWVTAPRLHREGWLALCTPTDTDCIERTYRFAGDQPLKRIELEQRVNFWTWSREPYRYIAFLALPQDQN